MGQQITVSPQVVGDVAIFDTNRTITGQDGSASGKPEAEGSPADAGDFPGQLADRLLAVDASIDHVFVQSNVVTVRRSGGWDDPSVQAAADVIAGFFRFYPDE